MKFFILSLTILIGLVTLNAKELPLPRGSAPVPTKIVDRRIVDKTNCLNMVRGCGDDNHECWKNTWNTGYFFYSCEPAYCKHGAKCPTGYRCEEWRMPCDENPDCRPYNCVKEKSIARTLRPVMSTTLKPSTPPTKKNPCVPNPCGPYKACVPSPKFCIRAPCPQYVCFGI